MTTQEIANSVRRKALETSSDILTDAVLIEYINLAYLDVYKRIYPNSDIASSTITCVAGVCTLPATFGTLYGEPVDTSSNRYQEVSIASFVQNEVDRAVTVEGGTLKVSPTSITSLDIKYYPKPVSLALVSSDPTIDDFFHEPIVFGALARVHEDLQDENMAQYYRERFNIDLRERIETQSLYEETNQRGNTMFTALPSIDSNQSLGF